MSAPPIVARPRPALSQLKPSKLDVPIRALIYGDAGIGKSTFGSSAPSPIFLGAEDGTAQLSVARYPGEISTGDDILEAIDVLTMDAHDFHTLVFDSVDWAEPLVWSGLCAKDRVDSIEKVGGGYGKGYRAAQEYWLRILRSLEVLQAKREMNVVLIGHSIIKRFANPAGEDYDHYVIAMNEKSAGTIVQWAHDVLYAEQEVLTVAGKAGSKAKAVTSGDRVVYTEKGATFFAKNRNNLPRTMPLSWDDYYAAVKGGEREPATAIAARVDATLSEYSAAHGAESPGVIDIERVRAAMAVANGDGRKLAAIENKLRVRIAEEQAK